MWKQTFIPLFPLLSTRTQSRAATGKHVQRIGSAQTASHEILLRGVTASLMPEQPMRFSESAFPFFHHHRILPCRNRCFTEPDEYFFAPHLCSRNKERSMPRKFRSFLNQQVVPIQIIARRLNSYESDVRTDNRIRSTRTENSLYAKIGSNR